MNMRLSILGDGIQMVQWQYGNTPITCPVFFETVLVFVDEGISDMEHYKYIIVNWIKDYLWFVCQNVVWIEWMHLLYEGTKRNSLPSQDGCCGFHGEDTFSSCKTIIILSQTFSIL